MHFYRLTGKTVDVKLNAARGGIAMAAKEKQRIRALFVSNEKKRFANLEAVFSESKAAVTLAESGRQALASMAGQFYDLVVADETLPDMTGLQLAEKAMLKHPMSNFAVVSALSHEDFHEASEGLGILMQLQPNPDRETAKQLLDHLKNILTLMGRAL